MEEQGSDGLKARLNVCARRVPPVQLLHATAQPREGGDPPTHPDSLCLGSLKLSHWRRARVAYHGKKRQSSGVLHEMCISAHGQLKQD